jgi:transcriptional regulator with XRE-family HTH domain
VQEAKVVEQADLEVGGRIRSRRRILGMSQGQLAEQIGLTFQQVQKYEKGSNRVGSSRLRQIADALGVPPAGLFGEGDQQEMTAYASSLAEIDDSMVAEALVLNRAFRKSRMPKFALRSSVLCNHLRAVKTPIGTDR